MQMTDALDLADWRRKMFELYAEVRAAAVPEDAWQTWRDTRDELFGHHPQSPIPENERDAFEGLDYFAYDLKLRVSGRVSPAEPVHHDIATSATETLGFTRFGVVDFETSNHLCRLDLFWLDGYGGGIFLPFKDTTSGASTYGGGRYLLDTIKGADLGTAEGDLILDFNFAYNPSCSYDPRWVCPLSPPENGLDIEIEAGERFSR